jgi:diguanylate cyclase (GGDEF)-like protein/PAS domain S-box-containing protein
MSIRGLFRATPGKALNTFADGDRELVLERAYATARIAGGSLAVFVAPSFGLSLPSVAALILFTVAGPGFLHIWLWRRTKSAAGRERVRWIAVANDCISASIGLALFSRDPMWTVVLVVPLLIFVETIRAGAPGGIITTIVITMAHVILADLRRTAYGFTTDPTTLIFQVGLYWLALVLAVVIFRELQVLQVMRAELFGPLLAAQDRFGDGVLIRKGDRFVFVGDAMREITGREPEELETLPSMLALVVPVERDAVAARLKLPGPDRFETRLVHRDGHEVPVEIVRTEVTTSTDPRVVAVVRDISERRAVAESLEFSALHDQLTGLPNRLFVSRAIDAAISAGPAPVAVIAMHLDHFRDVKETFGHRAADELLRHVASRVRARLRSMDVLSHGGGDEFMIVLIGADAAVAERMANNVRDCFADPFDVVGRPLLASANLGIAARPEHGEDATTLLRCAEIAAGHAARLGRGTVVYDPSHDAGRVERMELLADLRDLLARGELGLAFQPTVDVRTGMVRGFEALARWDHPTRGPVLPTEFIQLAEYSGLIKPLTEYILRRALDNCRAWREQGVELDVAVNVSIRNLVDADFPDQIARWLTMHDVPAERLTIEVTESLVMADLGEYVKTLTQIRRLGVRVALDDFGSGYSSLTQLHRLPVTQAKIDRGLIERLGSPDGDSVVRAAVDIAHALGLEAVAEGVASTDMLRRLESLGCDLAQGFAIAMPMRPEDVLPWVRARQRPLRVVSAQRPA